MTLPEALILDTNVVAVLMGTTINETVEQWMDQLDGRSVYLTTITRAEIRYGIARLPSGARRNTYERAANRLFDSQRNRTWSFDADAADIYGEMVAERERRGRPVSVPDGQIAAIARSRNAAVVTRNVADFEGVGIDVINPFDRP